MEHTSNTPPSPETNDTDISRRDFIKGVAATTAAVAVSSGVTLSNAQAAGNVPVFRIHPAIGIARVGNLDPDIDFLIGPEIPGHRATEGLSENEVVNYKNNGEIKAQAARFRVFEYRYDQQGKLTPVREVLPQAPTAGTPFVKAIKWKVHLANRKASFYESDGPLGETKPAVKLRNPSVTDRASLENDFGPRTISGAHAVSVKFTPWNADSYAVRSVIGSNGYPVIDYLGQLRTDTAGRLLVFGGKGRSASSISPPQPITHWANNNYWFDDMSDGPVTAVVTMDDGFGNLSDIPMDDAGHAWVLTGPPDYSPGVQAGVTLYDMLYDMGVRKLAIPANNALYSAQGPLGRLAQLNSAWKTWINNPVSELEFGNLKVDYEREIWPIVLNAFNLTYTTALVNFKHNSLLTDPLSNPSPSAARDREHFFGYLRAPENAAANVTGNGTMPKLYGDNWYIGSENFSISFGQNGTGNADGTGVQTGSARAVPKYQRYSTLTPTQYALLRSWSKGKFDPPSPVPTVENTITPHGLDRANLENGVGGPFYPGIECSWQMRNPALFIEPFRLNLKAVSQFIKPDGNIEGSTIQAGHFSRQMALPWHADFNDCSKLLNLGWWPTARPDDVLLNAGDKLSQRVPWARPDSKWSSGSTTASYDDMIKSWYKFGFIINDGTGVYTEKERNKNIA